MAQNWPNIICNMRNNVIVRGTMIGNRTVIRKPDRRQARTVWNVTPATWLLSARPLEVLCQACYFPEKLFLQSPGMNASTDILPRRHRITVDEYHRMGEAGIFSEDDRVELIEGEIIDMTPIGFRHASVVDELNFLLAKQLPDTYRVRVQNPLRLSETTEPQPDLVIVRRRSDRYAESHPTQTDVLLLIEVADTSAGYDRSVKIPLYARHGIPEVWLVDLAGGSVEVFRHPSPSGYQEMSRHAEKGCLRPHLLPEVKVDLERILGG